MSDSSKLIEAYFPDLNLTQREQLTALGSLYAEWNEKINVISRKDIDHLYERHVLHSLGIAQVLSFFPGMKVLDVGTGGGFPGIPLAILYPEVDFHLVDSIGKKITVVRNVAESLGLTNVVAEQTRAEQLNARYHYVVSRAVTRLGKFYPWVKNNFRTEHLHPTQRNGMLLLKGGELTEELAESGLEFQRYPLSDYFTEEFFQTKEVVYVPVGRR